MSRVKQLYELQEIDLAIESKREALREVESQLGEDGALVEARLGLEQERKHLAELIKRQREVEWEVEELGAKVVLLEGKLYGGSVRNPKELISLNEEFEHLKRQRGDEEDRVLDIMSDVEVVQDKVAVRSREVERMESEWQEKQAQLLKGQAELSGELAELGERRQLLALQIDQASLDLYEALRITRQGEAVAKVEQGMCQGCRINLPMTKLQRARIGQELVQCSNCRRILYVS